VVFTGAGISTAAGIPDYRGPDGVLTKRPPVMYHDFLDDPEERARCWRQKTEDFLAWNAVPPTAAHDALARLEHAGKLECVVTQNVDGLHRRAGHAPGRLVELHGSNLEAECVSCARRVDAAPLYLAFQQDPTPPRCACGGWMKPAVVLFGQSLRSEDVERTQEAVLRCDLVLSVGSTLQVQPAASLPLMASRLGIPYLVLNRGPTAHDDHPLVTKRLECDVNAELPAAIDAALSMSL
jgi:NAD-dependent deacetylase